MATNGIPSPGHGRSRTARFRNIRAIHSVVLKTEFMSPRSILKHFKNHRACSSPETTSVLVFHPINRQSDDLLRLKHARNRARTQKNSSKVEHYLTEVEKAHG